MMKKNYGKVIVVVLGTLLVCWMYSPNAFAAQLLNTSGKVVFLRLQAAGGYGPPNDFIDGEVVIKLSTKPGMAFGMPLRNNNERPIFYLHQRSPYLDSVPYKRYRRVCRRGLY